MWKLFKAEVSYYQIPLNIVLIIYTFTVFYITAAKWETSHVDYSAISSLLVGMVITFQAFRNVKNNKEKNLRLLVQLPVRQWKISIFQLLFVNAFYTVSLMIFTLFIILFNRINMDVHFLFYVITISGLVLIFNTAPFFHLNIKSIFNSSRVNLILTIFYILFIGGIYLIFIPAYSIGKHFSIYWFMEISEAIHSFGQSFPGAFYILVTGILFSITTVFLFAKRKTYFE